MEVLKLNSTGPLVGFLQSTLIKIGFYKGAVNNVFDKNTENAVKIFQQKFGLTSDGIVGEKTWNALIPYINGIARYKIKSGDTIFKIAKKFSSSTNRILFANPNLNVYNLRIDQEILVPFSEIVPTNVNYTSEILRMNIDALKQSYPFIQTGSIGNSALGKPISYIKLGAGEEEVFYSAAIHRK